MATGLPTFSEFDVNDTSRQAERLNKLLSRFQNLLVTMISIDKKWQRALLLHYASEATYELFLHGIKYNCFVVIRCACHLPTLIQRRIQRFRLMQNQLALSAIASVPEN